MMETDSQRPGSADADGQRPAEERQPPWDPLLLPQEDDDKFKSRVGLKVDSKGL